MIDFQKAIDIATTSAKSLIQNASNFVLEGVLLSEDNKLYEVSLSYDIEGKDPLGGTDQGNKGGLLGNTGLLQLSQLMRYRREYKVFLVDSGSGQFRGFKNQRG